MIKKDKPMSEEKLQQYPFHMQSDYRIRNDNIEKGFTLCEHCGGTGNELFSMYRACPKCSGKGHLND